MNGHLETGLQGPANASTQRLIRLSSGILVTFAACGFGAWFSGAASWIAFYAGARGGVLTAVAQTSAATGFTLAAVACVAWIWWRHSRGVTHIPVHVIPAAFSILPLGSIFWAIFVDAIAYHYGRDIVRPAFDYVLMYIILGSVAPLGIATPLLISYLRRCAQSVPTPAACAS
jgi:hypothetical protein